jgi:hypothetical protein
MRTAQLPHSEGIGDPAVSEDHIGWGLEQGVYVNYLGEEGESRGPRRLRGQLPATGCTQAEVRSDELLPGKTVANPRTVPWNPGSRTPARTHVAFQNHWMLQRSNGTINSNVGALADATSSASALVAA